LKKEGAQHARYKSKGALGTGPQQAQRCRYATDLVAQKRRHVRRSDVTFERRQAVCTNISVAAHVSGVGCSNAFSEAPPTELTHPLMNEKWAGPIIRSKRHSGNLELHRTKWAAEIEVTRAIVENGKN
jgi:hypothetical protein